MNGFDRSVLCIFAPSAEALQRKNSRWWLSETDTDNSTGAWHATGPDDDVQPPVMPDPTRGWDASMAAVQGHLASHRPNLALTTKPPNQNPRVDGVEATFNSIHGSTLFTQRSSNASSPLVSPSIISSSFISTHRSIRHQRPRHEVKIPSGSS
jgi:hypothetical protein